MQTFTTLSFGDKWRVSRYLIRGEAPEDPRMAAAAVEVAEGYQRQSRAYTALMRWFPVILIVVWTDSAIAYAAEGDELMFAIRALLALAWLGYLLLNPVTWPKNMARSLEASRRVVAAGV